MSEKKADGLTPLLRNRRDYDGGEEVESMMVKPLPMGPLPTPQEAIQLGVPEIVPSMPQSKDYDEVGPIIEKDKGCGGPVAQPNIQCPVCNQTSPFKPDMEEDMAPEMIIICPKCANSAHVGDFFKTANGNFVAKIATCLDPDFKAIKRLLPKGKELTLNSKDVVAIHKKLDKIYETYRKFEKEIK